MLLYYGQHHATHEGQTYLLFVMSNCIFWEIENNQIKNVFYIKIGIINQVIYYINIYNYNSFLI